MIGWDGPQADVGATTPQPRSARTAARARSAPLLTALALLTPLAAGLAGCGRAPARAAGLQPTCQQIAAVLSDGPDPKADPVGYALAQVRPLEGIHTSDRALATAIGRLATAYHSFYTGNGQGTTAQSVASASRAIDRFCPGVA